MLRVFGNWSKRSGFGWKRHRFKCRIQEPRRGPPSALLNPVDGPHGVKDGRDWVVVVYVVPRFQVTTDIGTVALAGLDHGPPCIECNFQVG